MIAYANLVKVDKGIYQLEILATYRPDLYPVGFKSGYMTRDFARAWAKDQGLCLRLPSLADIKALTRDKAPHFFTRSSVKFHDRQKGSHALKVVRGEDGSIQVTNGRSKWRFTGDNLRYIMFP